MRSEALSAWRAVSPSPRGGTSMTELKGYHAHIYYDPASRPTAERLCDAIDAARDSAADLSHRAVADRRRLTGFKWSWRGGRQPPPLAREPACVIRLIGRAPQRSDGREIAPCQRRRQFLLCGRISPADARDDPHPAGEPRGVAARITGLAGDHQKATPAFGIGQR